MGWTWSFVPYPTASLSKLVPELAARTGVVVDLAADFRLKDPDLYPLWYGEAHRSPELLSCFAYGLPELFRPKSSGHGWWLPPVVTRRRPPWLLRHCFGPG